MKVTNKKYTGNIHYYTDDIPEKIKLLLKEHKISNIIDLGCGDGSILYALKKLNLLKNKKVYAIDISRERIERVKKIADNFICLVGDVCRLPKEIKNNYFDLVISSQVIEHMDNPEKMIKEIGRILKTNAFLYLGTVFKKKYAWYFYRNNGKWVLDPTHIREYTQENDLLHILQTNNLKILTNTKQLFWFPITDFFLKRMKKGADVYNNRFVNFFRKIKLPILGYYKWELCLQKK